MKRFPLLIALIAAAPIAAQDHEYIDLNLPSGTLWAAYNIGASFEGDTTAQLLRWANLPYDSQNPNAYDQSAYELGNAIQGTQYDPATAAWGDEWCTPTLEQWHELLTCCYGWRYHTSVGSGSNGPQIMTLKIFRCYDTDGDGYVEAPENEDTAKAIVFTFHDFVSGNNSYYAGQYWAATQNLESWPHQPGNENIWYWTEQDDDYTETFDMNGHPHHLYKEHGYAYSFSILSKHMVFLQGLRPVYERKMIRAVRKQGKPSAVKPAWAETPKPRPVYKMGPVIIYNDGTKVLEK